MDLTVARRQPLQDILVEHNGTAYSNQGQRALYESQMPGSSYPGQLPISIEIPGENKFTSSHRVHQNSEAILKYNKSSDGKVREGRHAAAVDQIHQNDLHNIENISEMPKSKEVSRESSKFQKHQAVSSSQYGYSQDTELITSFDPMLDRHKWAMWRTAVNGRIVDEVRRLEKLKMEKGFDHVESGSSGVYGTALVVTPLKQFIKFDNDERKSLAEQILSLGQGNLPTAEFVYYGLPRVRMPQTKK